MAKSNLIKKTNFTIAAREVDFVTRFSKNWTALREILGIMRPIRKQPGTVLTSSTATVTLADGAVGEGEEIPYSTVSIAPVAYADIEMRKYAKAVSIEAVDKWGAAVAVEKTDDAFLNELQTVVLDDFYDFMQTGRMISAETTFQMAIAMAIGNVTDKFKRMRRDATSIVVWVNTIDAYRYLGAADLTVQTQFGVQYVENFMGADRMILTSEIPQGVVIATPTENIDLYYVDPGDSDFAKLGLSYTVEGETNLIGFHAEGDYKHAVGESFALMGMKLWAEYIDGIAIVYVGTATKVTSAETITADSSDTSLYKTAHSPLISVQELKDGSTAITDYTMEKDGVRLASAPSGTVTIKYTYAAQS